MKCHKSTLSNSLRVLTIPMTSLESVTITVWVGTGSRYETKKIGGISHFLEHMGFKGGQKYQTSKEVSEAVDAIGAVNNAATSKEWTNYYIKCRSAKIEKAFDILSDMLVDPKLRQEDINRERGVILEEYAMKQDTPMYEIGDVFENLIYKGHTLGADIIGTPQSIKDMQRNDFLSYRNKYYIAKNMLITVAGGINHPRVVKLAQKYFARLAKGQKSIFSKANFHQQKPNLLIKHKKTDQAHMVLGFRSDKKDSKDRYTYALLATILGQGMSSRLFTQIREKRGLAYTVQTANDTCLDNGYLGTYIGTSSAKADESIKVALSEHYNFAKVSMEELKKAQELIKGRLALALESTNHVCDFFGEEMILLGKVRTPNQVYENIDQVSANDITNLAQKIFQPQNLNIAVIGPYKSDSKFAKLIK